MVYPAGGNDEVTEAEVGFDRPVTVWFCLQLGLRKQPMSFRVRFGNECITTSVAVGRGSLKRPQIWGNAGGRTTRLFPRGELLVKRNAVVDWLSIVYLCAS